LVPTSDTHFLPYIQRSNMYQIFEMDAQKNVLGFTLDYARETLKYTKNK